MDLRIRMRIWNTGTIYIILHRFCLIMEGSGYGSGAGTVLVTNGSGCGSGRPKNIRMLGIWIRDPQHCCKHNKKLMNTYLMRHYNLGKPLQTCVEELEQHPHIERGIVREQEDGIFGVENTRRRIAARAGEQ
jgi:hypothetical protein